MAKQCAPVQAYIGLGSNLQQPVQQIIAARQALVRLDGVTETAFSSLYRSPPMGPAEQPDYINAVMAIMTHQAPLALLHALQHIEHVQGRVRQAQRWVARTLDLDILVYGNQQLQTPELTIPHSGLAVRAFVLYPLQEIDPNLVIPGLGAIADLVATCPLNGLERLPHA